MDEIFKIERLDHITKITNLSSYTVKLSLIPVKPKRKISGIVIIFPDSYQIFDFEIDLTTIYFSFEVKK